MDARIGACRYFCKLHQRVSHARILSFGARNYPACQYIGEANRRGGQSHKPAMGALSRLRLATLPELIIGFLALNAGLIDIVKASITGSIISNLLLVLGFAMFAGGWKREKQTFNRTGVLAAGSTLFIAAVALIMPAIFASSASGAVVSAGSIEDVSLFVSVLLLCMYVANLTFSLHTHKHLYAERGSLSQCGRCGAGSRCCLLQH